MANNSGSVKIPDKYVPGIKVSDPHTSKAHPFEHQDITFDQGRLPGQLPLPFPKIHVPVKKGK
jgi:hypothetical protein